MITDNELNKKRLNDIRQFVRDLAIPAEAQVVELNKIPEHLVDVMRANGYLAGVSLRNMAVVA